MKQVRVTILEVASDEDGWPPTNATECVAWFTDKLNAIPPEHRAAAEIEIAPTSPYESYSEAKLEIYYDRPETDDELKAREAGELRRQEEQRARELRTLAELKAKYEAGE